ncbi:MAG: hypothetical protein AAB393_11360, partial [Bacteroidota bacterium]
RSHEVRAGVTNRRRSSEPPGQTGLRHTKIERRFSTGALPTWNRILAMTETIIFENEIVSVLE